MAAQNFAEALKRVLVYEGGYSNHPKDPGGVTLEGVIQRVYDGYRQRNGLEPRPLTPQMRGTAEWKRERDAIYRLQYWDAIKGDRLPSGVDFVVFDGAVNSGPVQSAKWLQRALGIEADGAVGVLTTAAADDHPDHDRLIKDICARRMAFLQQLKTWGTFGAGWSSRVRNVQATGQAWATGSVGPQPIEAHDKGGNAKAPTTDVAEAVVTPGQGTIGTTIGTATTGTLDTLQTTATSIQPLAESLQWAKYIVIAITLGIAAVTLYGVWRSYKAQRARNGEDTVPVPELGQ